MKRWPEKWTLAPHSETLLSVCVTSHLKMPREISFDKRILFCERTHSIQKLEQNVCENIPSLHSHNAVERHNNWVSLSIILPNLLFCQTPSCLTFYSAKLHPAHKLLFCQTLSRRNFYSAKLYPAETFFLLNSILPKFLFCQTLSGQNFCSAKPYLVVKMFCLAPSWNFFLQSILNDPFHHKNDEWHVRPSG